MRLRISQGQCHYFLYASYYFPQTFSFNNNHKKQRNMQITLKRRIIILQYTFWVTIFYRVMVKIIFNSFNILIKHLSGSLHLTVDSQKL